MSASGWIPTASRTMARDRVKAWAPPGALHRAVCALALVVAAGVRAATLSIEAGVEQIAAIEDNRQGGCAAKLETSLGAAGLDCPGDWVTFDCAAPTAHGGGDRMYGLLRAAVADGKSVALTVTDEAKTGGYCRAGRVTVQDSPFVDVDSDGDGVDDLDDDVPLDAFEVTDSDDDGIGDITDEDDDNDGVPDVDDALPTNPDEWQDTDGDGIGNVADLDDDGDGVLDTEDLFPVGTVAFDLHHGSDNPIGIVAADGNLYMVDRRDERVYAFTQNGVRYPSRDFDLVPDRREIRDIAYASGHFYLLYERLFLVHAYTPTGDRAYERDFSLDAANTYPLALDYHDGLFRVVQYDATRSSVLAYTELGERVPVRDFDLDAASKQPGSITHRAGAVYVLDLADAKAYAYTQTGERRTTFDFDIEGGYAAGFTYAAGRFRIAYLNRAVAIAHLADGRRAPADDFDASPGTNDAPAGVAYFEGKFYVIDKDERKVFVYSTSGEHLADRDFALSSPDIPYYATFVGDTLLVGAGPGRIHAYHHTGGRIPSRDLGTRAGYRAVGIEHANGRVYVGDADLRRLAAYTADGERTERDDVRVLAGPQGPRGIGYGHGRFYTGDWTDEPRIFAYDALGRHLPDYDFDLGAPFRGREGAHGPAGMVFADGALYVLDWRSDRILPYAVD